MARHRDRIEDDTHRLDRIRRALKRETKCPSAPGGTAASHSVSQAIGYHDALAEGWTRRYASGGFKRRADFFTSQVLPKTRIAGEWIDVGCGSGFFSRILASAGANVLGVDGSAPMIAAARAFAGRGPDAPL